MCLLVKHTHKKNNNNTNSIQIYTHTPKENTQTAYKHTQRKYTQTNTHIQTIHTHTHKQKTTYKQMHIHTHNHSKSITHLADAKHRALRRVREVGGASLDKQQHFLLPLASEGGEVGKEVLPRYLAVVTAHPVHLGHAGHGSLHSNRHYITKLPRRHWPLPTPTLCGQGSYHSGVGVTSSVDTVTAIALPCRHRPLPTPTPLHSACMGHTIVEWG